MCRSTFVRCSAPGRGRFAGWRCRAIAKDIDRTDELALELFPENEILTRWLKLARGRFAFQGLPARICWLGYGERQRMGEAINELVRKGEISAPIAMGRDHLDAGSVASPYRETEKMLDGSDAVADWPILNALLNTASRRDVGELPSWRRRGDGLFAARGTGDGGGWDGDGCEKNCAGAE